MEPISTDGRAFLQRVRRATVASGALALWYIGGAGYIARTTGATLLIDPFLGPSNPPDWMRAIPPAFAPDDLDALGSVDAVLITHEHSDHADPVALAAIAALPEIPVLGTPAAIEVATRAGLDAGRAIVFPPESSRPIGDLTVTAAPMHDPTAQSANGYLLETGETTLLLCGDSLYFSGFLEIGRRWALDAICLTVGANPPGMTVYMGESDVARATRDSGAASVIVQHYDLWQGLTLDPERVRTVCRWYAPDTKVIPARFQRRITLAPGGASR
ncbi:MAG TPA: MBL fold metallo-hydrolase [Thermomicrobiales bacterium]|nr:MBL fold metallo-hydrolase [Thermomicrobiales bacterium]